MRDKILEKSNELFLNLGFKSVTMDEIAASLGVSKKTIYKYFKNKTELIDTVTHRIFDTICSGIDDICELELNPIEELFSIKRLVLDNLKDEKSSPQYQLQKYYPNIYSKLKEKEFKALGNLFASSIVKGIKTGLFRQELDIDFVLRIFFNGIRGIRDINLFPIEQYNIDELMISFSEYHLRAICTPAGTLKLETYKKEMNL